jgi:hypothetical protein
MLGWPLVSAVLCVPIKKTYNAMKYNLCVLHPLRTVKNLPFCLREIQILRESCTT